MRSSHIRTPWRIALLLTMTLGTACGTAQEAVQLSSAADTPTATADTPQPAGDPTPTVEPQEATAAAPPDPSPAPEAPGTAALTLRTHRPVDGFDLDPPDGFSPAEDYPMHGVSMLADGHQVGIRFYHKRGTSESVLVAVWSDRAGGAEERLERYQLHTGEVTSGRRVHGTAAVWELRERSAPEAPTTINLSVAMPDDTMIWLSGVNITNVSLLYEFLTRIEDAPGSLTSMPDPGGAMPGGVQD